MTSPLASRWPVAVLAPAVIDRIAAGEVVDRPDAVVRELVDNALDAGARRIQVELRGGGLDLVRVADDGHGILANDMDLVFERHSTSKLRSLADLAELRTHGFRGEALPSIAAAADVELVSSSGQGEAGRRVLVRGGRIVERGWSPREQGTTVWARALFAGLPARRSFLREPRAEVAMVARRLRWSAVANAEVRFELTVDGRLHFRGGGHGRRDLALVEAHGDDLRDALVEFAGWKVGPYQVSGLISVGGLTRPSRQHLALFVNRRRVRVSTIDHALDESYRGLLPGGRHPIGAIFVEAPPWAVDVNVHPSKEQVRLQSEPDLAAALGERIRSLLQAAPPEPSRLDSYHLHPPLSPARRVHEDGVLWPDERRSLQIPRYLAQLHASLLLCEGRQGLVLVDQHRAHERVIFEQLRRASREVDSQPLLEPAIVDVVPSRADLIATRLKDLAALGFEYERFGDHAYRLRAAPVTESPSEMLSFAATALEVAGERDHFWRDRLLATVACRSAVKKGAPLPAIQAARLVEDLFHTKEPTICPHGSPTVLQLTRPFMRRQFRW